MSRLSSLLFISLLMFAIQAYAQSADRPPETAIIEPRGDDTETASLINEYISAGHRSDANIRRNRYRNPIPTLMFFGLRPDMTVVELWPGTGWYTEILAPVLARGGGRLLAAQFPVDAENEYQSRTARAFAQKLQAEPDVYRAVEVVPFAPPQHARFGEPNSADMVLMARNFHSILGADTADAVLRAAFDVLRPGGVLAVVQHRAADDAAPYAERQNGYVSEAEVIEHVTAAGFELDDRAEINANPADTRDWPMGVWTLPPTLAACRELGIEEQLACEQRYQAIGESDRMTLRFAKPR
jgi:predicted methyltransferase